MSQCGWCSVEKSVLFQCAQCNQTQYCNRECQKKHWILHRQQCAQPSNSVGYVRLDEINDVLRQLTQQTMLQRRLADIRNLGCHSPMNLFWSQHLEVRQSEINGLGVFATRTLPPHSVLTAYPCHLYSRGLVVKSNCTQEVDFSPQNLQRLADVYGYQLNDCRLIGVPELHSEKALLGHLLNDGCLVNVFHGTPLPALEDPLVLGRLLKLFYANALRHTNCHFRNAHNDLMACVVSTREIAAGEELLLSYGLSYWLEQNYGANVEFKNPFLPLNVLRLRETDAEFRRLTDEGLMRDREAMQARTL